MEATKIVPLSRRYEAHGKVFDSVTVRSPRWSDVLELGDPYEMQRVGATSVFIENTATIAAYVKRCVVEPGAEFCGELGVRDTRAVRDTVIGFFHHGEPPAEQSATTSETGPTS